MFWQVCAQGWGAIDVLAGWPCSICYFYKRQMFIWFTSTAPLSIHFSDHLLKNGSKSHFYLLLSPLSTYCCCYEQRSFSHSTFSSLISCDNVAIFIIRSRLLEHTRNVLTLFFCSFKRTFFMFHWNFYQVHLGIAAYLSFPFKYTKRNTGKLF